MTPEDKKTYERVVEEQPYCQICGRTYNLHIHHIIYRSQLGNNDIRNLIRLCADCHRRVHSNKKVWQKKLLLYQFKKYGKFTKEDVTKTNRREEKEN